MALVPVGVVGSLTAVALAQPAPGDGPVPSAAFRYAQEAARGLAKADLWAGEVDAVALSRDATRRDLVRLMQSVLKLPGVPLAHRGGILHPTTPMVPRPATSSLAAGFRPQPGKRCSISRSRGLRPTAPGHSGSA